MTEYTLKELEKIALLHGWGVFTRQDALEVSKGSIRMTIETQATGQYQNVTCGAFICSNTEYAQKRYQSGELNLEFIDKYGYLLASDNQRELERVSTWFAEQLISNHRLLRLRLYLDPSLWTKPVYKGD